MNWLFRLGTAVALPLATAAAAQTGLDRLAEPATAGSPAQGPALGTPAPLSPTVIVPAATAVDPADTRARPPVYRPMLPEGTPVEQQQADPSAPITDFVEALERAYWSNPQLLAERARLRSTDFRLPQARGEYGPQLQYSASYGYRHDIFEQPVGSDITRSGWGTTASAILSQPLFAFGRIRAGEDSARGQIAFARASLEAAEQQTLFNTIATYAAVLRDRGGVGIAADNVSLLAQESSDTRARFDVRESTATELQQVVSRLELARAQLLTAQRAAGASDAQFLRFVGAPAGELRQPNPLNLPVRTLEDAYAYADAHNPVLASAYARERISRAAVDANRADLFPRIGLEGRANSGTSTVRSEDLRQTELRGSITITGTLDSGIRQARLGEARAANDADWRLIDTALRENRAELADAWNEWQTQTAAIEQLAAAVEESRQALAGGLLQERAGLRTTLDVLELARDLLQVRTNYNTATTAAFVARARVLAAMGALNHAYLLPNTPAYDAQEHFRKVRDDADFPLLSPVARTLDSLATGSRADRPLRDPSAPVAVGPVDISPVQTEPGASP